MEHRSFGIGMLISARRCCLRWLILTRDQMLRVPSGSDSRPSTAGGSTSGLARMANSKRREYETVVAFEKSSRELRDTFAAFAKQLRLAEEGAECTLDPAALLLLCILTLVCTISSCWKGTGELAADVCHHCFIRS